MHEGHIDPESFGSCILGRGANRGHKKNEERESPHDLSE